MRTTELPTYSFLCPGCGEIRELQRPVAKRDEPVQCVMCVRVMVREQAAPGFALKGGGWFRDTYGPAKPKETME